MVLEEKKISRIIMDSFYEKLRDSLSCEVAIVGGGPSGLICGYILAKRGIKVALFERKGSLGGGMWGGGMMFNSIVVEEDARRMLDEFGIRYKIKEKHYLVADAPEAVSAIAAAVCREGVRVFNFMSAEDVVVRSGRVSGLVVNWTAVEIAGFHVDPLTVEARYVVDATGHEHAVSRTLIEKLKGKLGGVEKYPLGERSLNAELGEREVVQNSKEIFPGLYATGMAVNAVFGGHRMGPIFGGMFLSGEKVANSIIKALGKSVLIESKKNGTLRN